MELERISAGLFQPAKALQNAQLHKDDGSVVAECFMQKLSATQAYCVLGDVAEPLTSAACSVREDHPDPHHLQLHRIHEERSARFLLPVYMQFHFNPEDRPAQSHLIDLLAESLLGNQNLDLKKNITADFFEVPAYLRDESGFLVTDKMMFERLVFEKATLARQLSPAQGVKVSRYAPEHLNDLLELDNITSGYQRSQYIQELVDLCSVLVCHESERLVGALFAKNDRILAVYAEGRGIADALISQAIRSTNSPLVSLSAPVGIWKDAESSRPLRRRHTRVVPNCIDWTLVYAFNAGMSIV